jgi:hypothetical protein
MSWGESKAAAGRFSVQIQPGVHPAYEADRLDRVEVANGFGLTLKAVPGIIARHHKQIMDADAVELVKDRFDLVSILVFAREVDDGLDTEAANLKADNIRK